MKIKIICRSTDNFGNKESYSIDESEAHKAYYLFLHPDTRSVFKNGLALKGSDIDRIAPDYHGTMGWNPNHKLDAEDWRELRAEGIENKLGTLMVRASEIGRSCRPEDLQLPMSEVKLLRLKTNYEKTK